MTPEKPVFHQRFPSRGAALLLRTGVLAGLFLGCGNGGGGTQPDPGPEPELACPSAGSGIEVGGDPGSEDTTVTPERRVVLMGGGAEDNDAMTRFLEGAAGGDVLVLRASGSLTSYPNYFQSLAPSPSPSSATTVRSTVPAAAGDPAVLCWVAGAEAIWLAGGNQWNYLGGWPVELHEALAQANARGVAIGGTSAGAVSLGEAAFDARFGTVTSSEALADPLHPDVSVSHPSFALPELQGMLVDSHFMERNREGRLLAFLARFLTEGERGEVVGLGLDEGVALVIREATFRVFGPPGRAAWLYRVRGPATLEEGQPLSLSGILRARLYPGDQGSWPLSFDTISTRAMRVTRGLVEGL